MSDEAALLKAIISHADEDTPRLAYADWLDENGDPIRAEFIRVQCRLADLPPSDPDWVDLTERQSELACRLKSRYLTRVGADVERFYFGTDLIGNHEEPFRRGFPYFISCQTSGQQWTRDEVKRVTDALTRLVRTTTLRAFHPYSAPADCLVELLAAPVTAELTGLALALHGTSTNWQTEYATLYRNLCTNPSVRRVKHLFLYHGTPADAVAELTRATALESVIRMTIQNLDAPQAALEKFLEAPWLRRLGHFRSHLSDAAVAVPVTAGLGRLPALHTLDLPQFSPTAITALAAGEFPALARLTYSGSLSDENAKQLTKARFPALVAFEAAGGRAKNTGFAALLKAKWFERLRVFALTDSAIGDNAVKALTAHPVARTLRVLRLGDNSFGPGGLAALAKPGAFPALTTLNLHSYHKRKAVPADLVAFLSKLEIPTLCHLDLHSWPLGDAGAKALAANPSLANLARLDVGGCQIGDAGAQALFVSPHLQNLVELQMSYNPITTGADVLADRAVMPRLGECWLSLKGVPDEAKEKLRREGLYLIT
jgi:uncharacterized protein (TIGR02996 family)